VTRAAGARRYADADIPSLLKRPIRLDPFIIREVDAS